jgi:hypothetical protein
MAITPAPAIIRYSCSISSVIWNAALCAAGNVHSADGWDGVLKPVVMRYQRKISRIYFRADAGFANPDVYELLEAGQIKYAIRLPANPAQASGRATSERRASVPCQFHYQAGSRTKPGRVIAKVEWHPGDFVRVGCIVTNLSRPAERVVAFYNKPGTCEQWIKEGKGAIKWTRPSCRTFAANAVRLQLHALAYNLGNFLRTLATSGPIKDWSLTSFKEKLIKIGAKVVSHGRYVALFRWRRSPSHGKMFREILRPIAEYAAATSAGVRRPMVMRSRATDRRRASKCEGKWPDQPLDQTVGLLKAPVAVSTSSPLILPPIQHMARRSRSIGLSTPRRLNRTFR